MEDKKCVVVQGLGFVGAVMSLVVAESDADYEVIGVDLPRNQVLVDELNGGRFPIDSSDKKVEEYFQKVRAKGNFKATTDQSVYSKADIVVVDINLDVQKNLNADGSALEYGVDLTGFKAAMTSIASVSKEDILVLIETTVPPGTSQNVVRPIFEEQFKQRGLAPNFKIGHSYERVMPGPNYVDSIKNFYRVYSGIDEKSAAATEAFLRSIISTDEYPLTRLGNTNATEMAKVLENSFRAMNIAFIQEWTEFAENAGVDLHEVVAAIRMRPTHRNIMLPGLGVGGYCLTKDPLLASWSSQTLFNGRALNQSEKAVYINDHMPVHSFSKVSEYFEEGLAGKRVLILGISYLKDVGDTRFTPVELLYRRLADKGAVITIHDPYVQKWEELETETQSLEEIKEGQYDALILGTPHSIYFEEGILQDLLTQLAKIPVFDPHGALKADFIGKNSINNRFIITGKGNG